MRRATAIIIASFLTATACFSQPFEPDANTAALWHFDEASGTYTAHDATGNGYDMALEDGAEFTASGHFSGAVCLNDPDAKVNSGYLIGNGWDALTIDAFIFPTEITGPEHPIVERYRWHNVADPSYYLTILQDGSLVGGVYLNDPGSVYSSATTPPGTIETDQWYHVAMTWSSGEPTRIFLNGEMIAESQQVHEGTVRAGDDPLTIGWFHDEGYGDFFFQGKIDEVRISDIDRYPVQPGAPFVPDEFTEALWHFDEVPGTYTAYDATGNGYDMSLEDGAEFICAGLYARCVDITDADAKINSDYLIGNGWDELTIDAHIKLIEFNPNESPVVYRYEYYTTDPAYFLTIMPGGEIYAGVYQNNGGQTVLTTDPVIDLDTWYYIQMTWSSGGELKIFVDETIAGSAAAGIGSIRNSTHQLTIGWFHDTGYGDFYSNGFIDEVRISDIDRSEWPPPPPVSIILTPYNPPIVIPPGGDAFAYNVALANNGNEPATFDVWVNIEVPGGYQFPIVGPVYDLTLAAGSSIERDRTVFVPGNAPAGEYLCMGMIGTYPWTVVDSDAFTFIKEGSDGIWDGSEGWICTGEPFPGEGVADDEVLPEEFALLGVYPNPFNPITTIRFSLPEAARVNLSIYDISGRLVAALIDGWRDAGYHSTTFDGSKMASGVYIYRIQAGEFTASGKMVLMK